MLHIFNLHRRELSGSSEGVKLAYMVAVFETESDFYQALLWSLPSRMENAEPFFEKVLQSIKEAK